jgi:RNA polymerase primary sigma factor
VEQKPTGVRITALAVYRAANMWIMLAQARARRSMALGPYPSEQALVAQVIDGDAAATEHFLDLAAPTIWSAVAVLAGAGRPGEAAFVRVVEALKADGFRRLAAFQGRSTLAGFLALTARAVLIDDLAAAFDQAPAQAWPRFQRLFARDIRRRITRRFPRADTSARDDLYQEICLKLLEDDFDRIRKFNGRGNFEGYVLVMVDRLLIDQLRKEARRRRLPAAVEAMPGLQQSVFIEVAWKDGPADPAALLTRVGAAHPEADLAAVGAALEQVMGAVQAVRTAAAQGRSVSIEDAADRGQPLALPDGGLNAEASAIAREEDAAREAIIAAIKAAAETMPADERLYLQIYFSATEALPPREIARLMGRPIEAVRQIQQRVMRRVSQIAEPHKNQTASV